MRPVASDPLAADAAAATGVDARYRACRADADCVAVPRAACCDNGWKEAVAASRADAYARDYACKQTPRPFCPLYKVRDTRVARCGATDHLCEMVRP